MLVVGILFLWQPTPPIQISLQWPHELIARFGEALIIASVLAVTVELYTRTRMLKEVVLDVFQYIVGHPLPDQLKDRIRKLVRTDLIRRDMRIRYDFVLDGDRVTVTVSTEFKLVNFSSSGVDYQQRFEGEAHDSPRILLMRCVSSERAASYDFSNVPIVPNHDYPGEVIATGKKIKIRPNLNCPDISYVVAGKSQFTFPSDYSDVFSFIFPTVGTTVVEVGDLPPNLEVSISDSRADEVARYRWEFRDAFVPSEHFRIRWRRKKAS